MAGLKKSIDKPATRARPDHLVIIGRYKDQSSLKVRTWNR